MQSWWGSPPYFSQSNSLFSAINATLRALKHTSSDTLSYMCLYTQSALAWPHLFHHNSYLRHLTSVSCFTEKNTNCSLHTMLQSKTPQIKANYVQMHNVFPPKVLTYHFQVKGPHNHIPTPYHKSCNLLVHLVYSFSPQTSLKAITALLLCQTTNLFPNLFWCTWRIHDLHHSACIHVSPCTCTKPALTLIVLPAATFLDCHWPLNQLHPTRRAGLSTPEAAMSITHKLLSLQPHPWPVRDTLCWQNCSS